MVGDFEGMGFRMVYELGYNGLSTVINDYVLLMVYYCQKLRWFINGSLMVYSWFIHGLFMVSSWFLHGLLMIS